MDLNFGSLMLTCPSCSFENDEFATICIQCKSFLQNRVPNLDFFETAWGVIESPRATFRRITMAEHKNYVLLLSALFGIAVSFTTFWYLELGRFFDSLLFLVPTALGWGIIGGLILTPILSLMSHLVGRALGSGQRYRNSNALLAYALVPVGLSLVLILPIELLTFGMYLFTSNPHPYVIKPVSFVILVGFDIIMALWSIGLVVLGMTVTYRFSLWKAAQAVTMLLFVAVGAYYLVMEQVADFLRGR